MSIRKIRNFRDALSVVPLAEDRHALRNFNFMNSGQPPSVGELCRKLGFAVEFRSLPRSVSGFLEADSFSEKGWKIVINKHHCTVRQRWTALHEMAHYYLHPRATDIFEEPAYRANFNSGTHMYMSFSEINEEREANQWVAALIFGQAALNGALGMYGADHKKLARHFGVSEQAIKIQLEDKQQ